jgi:hypothetical protein
VKNKKKRKNYKKNIEKIISFCTPWKTGVFRQKTLYVVECP